MAQLEDIVIRTQDSQLKSLLSDIISFWNSGAFPFQVVSTPPTDNPGDAEIRLFDSGGGSVKLYFFSPTTTAWYSVTLS